MKTEKRKRKPGAGRKPHPQKHLTCKALNKAGELVDLPYMKKIIIELPAPFVDHIKRKRKEHEYATMTDMLRKIILTHHHVHILEVEKITKKIWGDDVPRYKGIPAYEPARRKLVR
jgi:hypothetical protein